MKAYISGPITGSPDYKERFDNAEAFLREHEFAVINPTNITALLPETETTYDEYLRIDLRLMEMCDIIFMLDGWEDSQGSRTELLYAMKLGMPAFYQCDFMKEEASA